MARPNPTADAIEQLAAAMQEQNALLAQIASRLAPKEPDRIGNRSEPKRLGDFLLPTMLQSIPGFAQQFQTAVPERYWQRDGDLAVVACPCKATVAVEVGGTAICTCQRAYLATGPGVHVAGSPTRA